jgi:hypothetical protein
MLNKSLIFVNTSPASIWFQHQQPEGTGRKPASSEHPVTSKYQKNVAHPHGHTTFQ